MSAIVTFAGSFDLLRTIFMPVRRTVLSPNPLMHTLQLVLSHLTLDLAGPTHSHAYQWQISQQAVYATAKTQPIFCGTGNLQINMTWLLHVANFFKYHLTREEECTLYEAFKSLTKKNMTPMAWQEKLQEGCKKLGEHWKGNYGQSQAQRTPY